MSSIKTSSIKTSTKCLSLITLLGVMLTTTAYAQSTSGSDSVSGDTDAPVNLNIPMKETAKGIFLRIHSLSVDTHLSEMKKDGVTERNFVAGFSVCRCSFI